MDTQVRTKCVVSATEVPEECVKRAQVVIVSEHSWHLIAPKPWKMHCLLNFAPVPAVACPIVDVRGITDEKSEQMFKIMQACVTDHSGVINLDGLLTGLEALGGKRWAQIETVKIDAGLRGVKKVSRVPVSGVSVKVRRVRGGVK